MSKKPRLGSAKTRLGTSLICNTTRMILKRHFDGNRNATTFGTWKQIILYENRSSYIKSFNDDSFGGQAASQQTDDIQAQLHLLRLQPKTLLVDNYNLRAAVALRLVLLQLRRFRERLATFVAGK